jgi:hypothetical protein
MSVLLWGVLVVVAVLAVLILALLVTPLCLDVTMCTSPKWRLKVAVRLFGGLTPPIPIHDSDRQRAKQKEPSHARIRQKKEAGRSRPTFARVRRVVSAAPHLLIDLLRPIHIQYLKVDLDVGLMDPADTGQLFGLLVPVIYSRRQTDAVSIAVRPDFTSARLSGEITGMLTFIPVAFIPPAIRFAWCAFGSRS